MDIFSPTILDNALITGSNDASLLQVSSPTAPSALFVSGSGNVGIGTATPVHNLVVNGSTGVSINANGATFPNIHRDSTDGGMLLRSWDGSTFTNNVKITPTSNVGIGTTSPTQKLDVRDGFIQVSGSGASGQGITIARAGFDTYQLTHEDGGLTIRNSTDNVKEMTFLGNGNVGINFQSPLAKLHISGASALRLQNAGFDTFQWTFSAGTGIALRNVTDSTNPFYIDGADNIGIGTTTPTQRLDVRGNTIIAGTTPVNPVGGTLEVYNNGSNAQITIHEDSGSAEARLAFRTEGSDTIFRNLNTRFSIDAEAKPDALTLSLFGRVGIGTSTSVPSSLLQIRGEGTASATTALRVENSASIASLTILDDGTSAFNTNHLYVSSSGRVGIGTTTPQRLFDVYNSSISGIAASFGAQISNNNFSGISFGYVEQANTLYRKSALVFERTETHGGGGNASGKIHFLLNNNSSTSATALTDSVLTIDSVGTTVGSSRVGIGTRFPTASLHISGTVATDNLMRVQSTTGAEYFFISASGNVGVGLLTPSARLHVSGANNQSLLRVSSPSASAALFISGSGNVGIGTETPTGVIDVFQGGNSRILVKADDGFVGIQQPSPTERIHITSDPATSKYLRIDAAQATNPPPRYLPVVPAKEIYGQNADDFALGTPDYWMEIILNGNIVLIPCYLPN